MFKLLFWLQKLNFAKVHYVDKNNKKIIIKKNKLINKLSDNKL